jgi:cytochrome bd ubiquinol oxidase subunit I
MNNLLAARSQMAMSLAFHIIFAVIGIGLPLMMVVAEGAWLRTGDPVYKILARRSAKGAAILFAVGAVSGTVLSFELGLLWPGFMKFAGAIIGMPFSLEGFAFFTEAIFLGIYLYGWDKVSPKAHLLAGVVVAISGAASGVLVVLANAWMNTPVGFTMVDGKIDPATIDPIRALFSPAAAAQTIHMTLAAYASTGFLAAGVHAFWLLKERTNPFHRKGLAISLLVGGIAALLQPLSGDYAAKVVARTQHAKLAAMEGQFKTERHAPLRIGGIPDVQAGETRYAIEVPSGLSWLAYGDTNAEVKGLNDIPSTDRPDVRIVHPAFQIMVACGMAMMGVSAWGGFLYWRKKAIPDARPFLLAVLLASPMGIAALEAGWVVTEVGRQPWIIHEIMRTSEAVTPVEGLWGSMLVYSGLYLFLGAIVVRLLLGQFRHGPTPAQLASDRGPVE